MMCVDCDANCRIPITRGTCHAVTTKAIARGEEMTISYGKVRVGVRRFICGHSLLYE